MVLYRDMLDVMPVTITKDYASCPNLPSFKITGDLYNLSLFYLAHRFLASSLPDKIKISGAKECMLLFNYRTISALTSNGFRYLSDPEAAQATYEKLSNRFILKQMKSWAGYMQYRADSVINKKSVHWDPLLRLNNDHKFIYAISDSQGRIADTFKQMYRIYVQVLEDGAHLQSTSTVDEAFGEKEIAEIYNNDASKINKTVASSNNPSNFYVPEIALVLTRLYPVVTEEALRKFIYSYSTHTIGNRGKLVNKFTTDALVWIYDYISTSTLTPNEKKSLPVVLALVRNGIGSSRSVDPKLTRLRTDGERVINAVSDVDQQLMLTYRTILLL